MIGLEHLTKEKSPSKVIIIGEGAKILINERGESFMEDKIKDLERLIEKYKHTVDGLSVEKILQESYFIKSEEEFYKVWEEYKEEKEQEEWTNYNKNLI